MTLEDYLKREYSPTVVNSNRLHIERYKLTMGERAEKATYSEVLDYIGLLRASVNSRTGGRLHPKTLRNNLFAIKAYYRYLVETGKRKDNPAEFIYLKDRIDRQIHLESLYQMEILEELYETWQSENPEYQSRDKIIISLLVYQALTVLEITQIKISDIDLEQGTIKIKGNAKNKGRTLSLKSKQILLIHNYIKQDWRQYQRKQKPSKRTDYFLMNNEGLQFWAGNINRMINLHRDKQDKLIPFKIRQSVIAHLIKENHDIRVVQEFAGHRRTGSTEAYKQSGLEELKSAIEKLHPLQ